MVLALTRLMPGLVLCLTVAGLAAVLERIEARIAGEPYLEGLVLAIVLGVAVRSVWTPGPTWEPGIDVSVKLLLEVAVVLLGASLSISTVLALGPMILAGIAAVVAVALVSSYAICRLLGLSQRMAILIACGNSICGNSAIAAVAPIISADSDEIASSIAFTAVLGVLVVLGLPLLVPILNLSLTQYGVLAGLTVYAVPQVLAATLPIGAVSNQVGTVVKLVRVLMLGPIVLGLSLIAGRLRGQADRASLVGSWPRAEHERPALHQFVPWFISGFLFLATMRSLGFLPEGMLKLLVAMANLLTLVAMVGLGLGVDVRVVARAGVQVTVAVTLSLLVLGIISFGLIWLVGMA